MRNRNFGKNLLANGYLEDQKGTGKIAITYVLGTDDGSWV